MGDDDSRAARTIRRRTPPRVKARRRAIRVVETPDPSAAGRDIVLTGADVCVLGRGGEGLGLIDDGRMSRRHAKLIYEEASGYALEDLGATNGTFVNGARVSGRVPLNPNDVVSVGDTLLVLDVEPPRDALPSAPDADGSKVKGIVGRSFAAEAHRRAIVTVAPSNKSVVLLGGTGTGKEVSARAIHELSGRKGELVAVNCAAIPRDLADAELFGHTAGAFTGATSDRAGHIVRSDGGTLFLDEVADLPEALQAKLLRVLEDGLVQPVGGGAARKVDLRVVVATHKVLESDGFRKDLFARLADWVLRIPNLAERKVDVLDLWHHFLPNGVERTMPEVYEALLLHDWPANVRELAKLAGRLDSLSGGDMIDLDVLPDVMRTQLLERLAEEDEQDVDYDGPEIELLRGALEAAAGNVKLAAQQNGWHRTQLYRWLRRARIDVKQFR